MTKQRRRDTQPELRLRRILHRRGWRYRVDVAPIAGMRRRADLVFSRRKVAVFVDGCFWHMCPVHASIPKTNRDWWMTKLEGNVRRDRDTDERLVGHGWRVVRIWEHSDPEQAADHVESVLQSVDPG